MTTVLFAPEDRIISYALREILSARKRVDIAVYLISSKRAANALVKAKKKGIAIRIITDGRVARTKYSQDDFLRSKGIEVKTIRVRSGSMHHKFIIIDKKKLLAGSANLTNDANYRNHEFIFSFQNRRKINQFSYRLEEIGKEKEKFREGRGGRGG